MCATVSYRRWINGKLYPKAARTGPFAFAEEVSRVNGKVVSRYLGIVKLPSNADVVEMGEESHDQQFSESEQVQQKLL